MSQKSYLQTSLITLVLLSLLSLSAKAGVDEWTNQGPFSGDIIALAIDPDTPATVYAGTYPSGVFKSTDSGVTWSVINEKPESSAAAVNVAIRVTGGDGVATGSLMGLERARIPASATNATPTVRFTAPIETTPVLRPTAGSNQKPPTSAPTNAPALFVA